MDDTLVRKIAGGDFAAFSSLYERFSERLFYYACKLTGDTTYVDDIVQEAFVMYWQNRNGFTDLTAVKAYLYVSVKNMARNRIRTETNRRRIIHGMTASPEPEGDNLIIAAELSAIVAGAVAELPGRTAEVISLSMAGNTVEQTSERLGISVNSVKTLKKSGYRLLRQKLSHVRSALPFIFPF